jgi:hypothetical protein
MSPLVRSYRMENITEIEVEGIGGVMVKHIIIDRGNGEFTSMLKSTWDELEAAKENGTIS